MGLFNRFKKNKNVNENASLDYASKFKKAVEDMEVFKLYVIFEEWSENDPSDANLYWAALFLENLRRVKINGEITPVFDADSRLKMISGGEQLDPTNKELYDWFKDAHNNVPVEMHMIIDKYARENMDLIQDLTPK